MCKPRTASDRVEREWSVRILQRVFSAAVQRAAQVLAGEAAWDACDFAGAELAAAPADGEAGYVHYFPEPGWCAAGVRRACSCEGSRATLSR